MVVALIPVIASLKVAVMLLLVATLVAFAAGVRPVTDGAGPAVVNVQLVGARVLPAASRMPLVSRTV